MTLGWPSIVRLGLVQAALGAIVVLMTSVLNRIMVVELALPAVLPGALVALHYGVQVTRPSWGFRSDVSGRRTRWILIGMAMLALGANGAAMALPVFETSFIVALALSVAAYALIGFGVGAGGTSLLALLATGVRPDRRAAAATMVWLMMIAGIAVTAGVVGGLIDPYSPARLARIVATVTGVAFVVTLAATWRVERGLAPAAGEPQRATRLLPALREVWAEPRARGFAVFVLLSMIAYFMQELILEPYGGLVFGLTAGETTALSGLQHGGVFLGMVTVGVALSALRLGTLRGWLIAGCLLSAAALGAVAAIAGRPDPQLLRLVVGGLGFANGVFAVAAIGAMMELAGSGQKRREGTRMGLWGAAQAIAAGSGGLLGAALADGLRPALGDATAFATVFALEALVFLAAATLAVRVMTPAAQGAEPQLMPGE